MSRGVTPSTAGTASMPNMGRRASFGMGRRRSLGSGGLPQTLQEMGPIESPFATLRPLQFARTLPPALPHIWGGDPEGFRPPAFETFTKPIRLEQMQDYHRRHLGLTAGTIPEIMDANSWLPPGVKYQVKLGGKYKKAEEARKKAEAEAAALAAAAAAAREKAAKKKKDVKNFRAGGRKGKRSSIFAVGAEDCQDSPGSPTSDDRWQAEEELATATDELGAPGSRELQEAEASVAQGLAAHAAELAPDSQASEPQEAESSAAQGPTAVHADAVELAPESPGGELQDAEASIAQGLAAHAAELAPESQGGELQEAEVPAAQQPAPVLGAAQQPLPEDFLPEDEDLAAKAATQIQSKFRQKVAKKAVRKKCEQKEEAELVKAQTVIAARYRGRMVRQGRGTSATSSRSGSAKKKAKDDKRSKKAKRPQSAKTDVSSFMSSEDAEAAALLLQEEEERERAIAAALAHLELPCIQARLEDLDEWAEELDLRHCCLGRLGAGRLAPIIGQLRSLEKLELMGNYIGSVGLKNLFEVLEKQKDLKVVGLSFNGIGDDGCQFLASFMQSHTLLQELVLSHNRIADEGAATLALAIQDHKSLNVLNLQDNAIYTSGAQQLIFAAGKRLAVHLNKNPVAEGTVKEFMAQAEKTILEAEKAAAAAAAEEKKKTKKTRSSVLGGSGPAQSPGAKRRPK